MKILLRAFFILLLLSGAAGAVQPNEALPDPQMEARARAISADLRCLVCQNQSIDDSDADLAHDLRMLVRQRLQAGDSDAEVKQFLVDRYGDYILLNPPLKMTTVFLWAGPTLFLLTGLLLGASHYRRRCVKNEAEVPLSAAEEKRIKRLLGGES